MIKYLLLGGCGFVCTNFAKLLLNKNCKVTSLDRIVPKKEINGVDYQIGDFFDDNLLKRLIKEHDVVIHAISSINPRNSSEMYMEGYSRDLIQTIKICDWIGDEGKKLIYLSSGGTVYGNQKVQPIVEDALPSPINHYGNVKLSIENALRIFHIQRGTNIRIARISNPYGPEQDYTKGVGFIDMALKKVLHNQSIEIWGDGNNVRDYIYIDDVCEMLYLLSNYEGENLIFNVSTGYGISQKQIVEKIRLLNPKIRVEYKKGFSTDARTVILDNHRIMELHKKQLVSINDGLKRYYDFLEKNI